MAGIYKTIASLILWPLWLVYFVFVMPLFYLYMIFTPQKYYHYFTRPMCWLFCLSGGQLLKLKGQLPPINNGPYIYMINHGSLFDLFVIGFYIKHYIKLYITTSRSDRMPPSVFLRHSDVVE